MTLRISYDPAEFDFDRIIPFIQSSYWGKGRKPEEIRAAFDGATCVGREFRVS